MSCLCTREFGWFVKVQMGDDVDASRIRHVISKSLGAFGQYPGKQQGRCNVKASIHQEAPVIFDHHSAEDASGEAPAVNWKGACPLASGAVVWHTWSIWEFSGNLGYCGCRLQQSSIGGRLPYWCILPQSRMVESLATPDGLEKCQAVPLRCRQCWRQHAW